METGVRSQERSGWLEASGLPHVLRTLGLAVHPAKIGLAFAALLLTFVLGGFMDFIWVGAGGGVGETAIDAFVTARQLDRNFDEPDGSFGVFRVFIAHERRAVRAFLGSSLPGTSLAAGTPVADYVESHAFTGPLQSLVSMGYGVLWLVRHHPFFFLIFGFLSLVLWALAGGAICRIAAVQFAKDEKLTLKQGLDYARGKLFGGFVLAPCIPIIFILVIAALMFLVGLAFWVPYFGDLVGAVLFSATIIGGFLIAVLIVGLFVGGSLFWPAVATEGSDAFDSFSRSLAYPLSKPWKAVLYAVLAIVFASLCWVLVNLFTYLALSVTRGVVGFGTAPFDAMMHDVDGGSMRKLDLLWPMGGPNALYISPQWGRLGVNERFSAVFIWAYVHTVIGLVWAFLFSFYFCGSTVVYFLLRRDVDGTELDEVQMDEEPLPETSGAPPPASAAPSAP